MDKKQKFTETEEMLRFLLHNLSETEYTDFVEQGGVISVYDWVCELDEPYEYLSERALTEVYDIVAAKVEEVKANN